MRSSGSYFPPDPSPGAKFREFPKAIEEEGHSCQSHGSAPATAKCVEVVGAAETRSRSGADFRGDPERRLPGQVHIEPRDQAFLIQMPRLSEASCPSLRWCLWLPAS